MTAFEKIEIANKFNANGDKAIYDAIIDTLTDSELLEVLGQ